MELFETIEKRQSIRDYEETPVTEEKLKKVLEAARLAPSAGNRQFWKFVVVRDKERREALCRAAYGQAHVGKAPVVIAAVATQFERLMECGVPAYAVDLAIAVDHITLAAHAEGLGTCWIGRFHQEEARDIIQAPDTCRVVALLPLGYAKSPGRPKNRKTFEEVVSWELYKE